MCVSETPTRKGQRESSPRVRWVERLVDEKRLTLAQVQSAAAALTALPDGEEWALRVLSELSRR
jgi:hypothetical protein